MRTRELARAALLVVSWLCACSEPTGTDTLPLTFQIGGELHTPMMFTAQGSPGGVMLTGEFDGGGCQKSNVQRATLAQGTVTFRLELSGQLPGFCSGELIRYPYTAVIGGLAPGTYRVRIEHYGTEDVNPGPGGFLESLPEGLRLEQEVTVR